jgi:hypothetical protein
MLTIEIKENYEIFGQIIGFRTEIRNEEAQNRKDEFFCNFRYSYGTF